jgi:segregation and condensation protein A
MPEPAPGGAAAGAGESGPGEPTGDALWDDWDTPLRAPATPVLHLEGYDGPMELLLDLAGRQRIDLGRLSILGLIEQFLAELDGRLRQVAIERRADWVVVASRLVLLRSRLLAPASPEVAAKAQRDADAELRRLEAAGQVRGAAAWLQARPQLGYDVFARPSRGPDPRTASYMALMQACLVVLRGSNAQPVAEPVYAPRPPELWSVAQALARIRAVLEKAPEGGELGSFLPRISRAEPDHALRIRGAIASTLMAGLELARNGELVLKQEAAFSAIELGTVAL